MTWVALYNGQGGDGIYAIGAATSPDGRTWTRYAGNPVFEAGSGWESHHVKDPCLIWDGTQYVMYYAGNDDGTSSGYQIGRATAPSVSGPWTRDAANPVLGAGTGGSFDDAGVLFPTVLYEPDDPDPTRRYKMWFGGYDGSTYRVGYAYSADGITWTKVGQVIDVGAAASWNDEGLLPGAVVNDGGTYHLFVGGRQGTTVPRWQGGIYTFTDPEGTYTPDAGNPTLLARFNDAGTSKQLTANASAGQPHIAVATTTGWNIGEVVAIVDTNSVTEVHRIASMDATTVRFDENLASTMSTAEGATARPMAWNSVIARSVIDAGAEWWIYGTPFQPVEDLSVSDVNKLREGSFRWVAGDLTDNPVGDYSYGLLFPLYPSVSGTWDDISAENPSVLDTSQLDEEEEFEPPDVGKAILEIYVHDEDASRWGIATWADGPATGDEGIWSAAGWQDVTPQGVNAHIIWGSRRPGRGILAQQDPASWNVETYDPDRVLDPGNADSPYYPQLVAGVPIRISHDSGLVIRTGIIDEIGYKHKAPAYRGQILASDTIALLHKAIVPADSILADTLHARIIDAITAAGVGVGGIPLPPPDYGGPTLAEWVEGAATDEGTSVWEITRKSAEEVHWQAYVNHDASLGLRSWGAPLDRGREITAPNLEDLEARVNEDGVYSVARVQPEDPAADPIEREAAPLPRYGRRVIDRREPTEDPEGWATAVLQERSWPGVQYIPGTIHCFDDADVLYFGELQIMERVTIIHPGNVSVQGRILGGELFVEHRRDSERGATWQFLFAVATDGSTAIGLDTLVSDQAGDTLLDDATETDYLEAD